MGAYYPKRLLVNAALICLALSIIAGCGKDGYLAVRGAITLDDKPLEKGLINFRPAKGTTSRSAGATIRDGAYQISAEKGLKPGEYLVTIQAFKPTGRVVSDPQIGDRPELTPVIFAENMPLRMTISPGQDNVYNLSLTTK